MLSPSDFARFIAQEAGDFYTIDPTAPVAPGEQPAYVSVDHEPPAVARFLAIVDTGSEPHVMVHPDRAALERFLHTWYTQDEEGPGHATDIRVWDLETMTWSEVDIPPSPSPELLAAVRAEEEEMARLAKLSLGVRGAIA